MPDYHCERCKGLGRKPRVTTERNPSLEDFLARWAQKNGYTLNMAHSPKRSNAKLQKPTA